MNTILEVFIEDIKPNEEQPRKVFSRENLQELADSILSVGLIHPPTVRKKNGFYELVVGERRWRAAQLAGLKQIPVILKDLTENTFAEMALIENIQRVDLNPVEVAKAMQALMNEFGLSQEGVALKVGKKRSTVANFLRLLQLSQEIQDSLINGRLHMGHAKIILSLEQVELRKLLHDEIVGKNLTVRASESLAKVYGTKKRSTLAQRDSSSKEDLKLLEAEIKKKTYLNTSICFEKKKGFVKMDFDNLDNLDHFLKILEIKI
jgi:ParB family chromosome partitioning protein